MIEVFHTKIIGVPVQRLEPMTKPIVPKDKFKKPFVIHYPAKGQEAAQDRYRWEFKTAWAGKDIIDYPVLISALFRYTMPVSWSKKKKAERIGTLKETKPDWDNLVKFLGDTLKGIVVVDDNLICGAAPSHGTFKVYSMENSTEVRLWKI